MKFKNNIPLQQHETTNELAQSSEYHLKKKTKKTLEVIVTHGLTGLCRWG